MSLLTDKELVALIKNKKITEIANPPADWLSKESPIQPTSLDLHIGKIFIPEADRDKKGGINNPKIGYHTLHSGSTAFVETAERLCVPSDIAGFGFPPTSTAVKGILMTNPGHIDPGFQGHLTFTLINMGKEPYTIRRGDILFTTLWIKLDSNVDKDYSTRTGIYDAGATEEHLDVLSKDFLNVDIRAKIQARKILAWATIIAAGLSACAAVVPYFLSATNESQKAIENLQKDMAVLEAKLEERNSKQYEELKEQFNKIKTKISDIEDNKKKGKDK